jgi:catechol 2,3-dioxygenase-like lactoylglutathione lyase family enzyme
LFEVQKLFHLTQVVEDLDEADRWYNRLFSPCRFYRGYMKEAFRTASMLAIGDAAVIEPVQVADEPGGAESPLGRFKARFGPRLHSVAWYVDDLENAVESLRSHGVRLVDVSGRPIENRQQAAQVKYVWTHPKDSFGSLEFARLNRDFTTDPRAQAHWSSSFWRDHHPLGICGPLRITITTRDVAAAARFYADVLRAEEVEAPYPQLGGRAFRVGSDTIIDLLDAAHADVGSFGEGIFGMSFEIQDIEKASGFLTDKGLPVRRVDGRRVQLAPEHALGVAVGLHQRSGSL